MANGTAEWRRLGDKPRLPADWKNIRVGSWEQEHLAHVGMDGSARRIPTVREIAAMAGLSEVAARYRLYRYQAGKLSYDDLTRPAEMRGARVAKQNKMEAKRCEKN